MAHTTTPPIRVVNVEVGPQNNADVTLSGPNQPALRGPAARTMAVQAGAERGVSRAGFSGWGDLFYVLADGRRIGDDNEIADILRANPTTRYTCEQVVKIRGGI